MRKTAAATDTTVVPADKRSTTEGSVPGNVVVNVKQCLHSGKCASSTIDVCVSLIRNGPLTRHFKKGVTVCICLFN